MRTDTAKPSPPGPPPEESSCDPLRKNVGRAPPGLLLLSRKFPPSVGGMQRYMYQLYRQMRKHHRLRKIVLGRSQMHLGWFVPWCLIGGVTLGWSSKITHVHVGDALLSPIGLAVARALGARASVTTYGLDVIYPRWWYQRMVGFALPRYDAVISISRATRDACIERGVSENTCHVVPPGVELRPGRSAYRRDRARKQLSRNVPFRVGGSPLLVSLGRHVRRKGFAWFVEHVMPILPATASLVLAGDGPERRRAVAAAESAGVGARVHFPGYVPEETKRLLLEAADVFVMPNRNVAGDMEGFGLVALEASSAGTPVVAAAIEGIRDAVLSGQTGLLVPERDARAFREAVVTVSRWDRKRVKRVTEKTFSWERTYRGYATALRWAPAEGDIASGRRTR